MVNLWIADKSLCPQSGCFLHGCAQNRREGGDFRSCEVVSSEKLMVDFRVGEATGSNHYT